MPVGPTILLLLAFLPAWLAPTQLTIVSEDPWLLGAGATLGFVAGSVGGTLCARGAPRGGGWLPATLWLLGAGLALALQGGQLMPMEQDFEAMRLWMFAGALGGCIPGAIRGWLQPVPPLRGVSVARILLGMATLQGTLLGLVTIMSAVFRATQPSGNLSWLTLVLVAMLSLLATLACAWVAAVTGPVQPVRQYLAAWAGALALVVQMRWAEDLRHLTKLDPATIGMLLLPLVIGVAGSAAVWLRARVAQRRSEHQRAGGQDGDDARDGLPAQALEAVGT